MSKITATTKTSDPTMMSWDTDFWGIRTAKATYLDGLAEWAVENTVGLVALLVDADRPDEIQEAEQRGFRFMDVRVTLTRPTGPAVSLARLARAEDTSRLRAIARHAFPLTRFYADPSLPDNRCDDLYEEWTRSLCAGGADVVLVIDRVVEVRDNRGVVKTPVGYITVNLDGDHSEIGLVAVADDFRGQGIGNEFVCAAVDYAHAHGAKEITVVTQGRNIGALRTFESCGFRVTNTSVWMHKHLNYGGESV